MEVEKNDGRAECMANPGLKHRAKILRLRDLCSVLGVSRSTIYNWANIQSPWYIPEFPKPIRIGRSAIGWREIDIDQYLTSRMQGGGK